MFLLFTRTGTARTQQHVGCNTLINWLPLGAISSNCALSLICAIQKRQKKQITINTTSSSPWLPLYSKKSLTRLTTRERYLTSLSAQATTTSPFSVQEGEEISSFYCTTQYWCYEFCVYVRPVLLHLYNSSTINGYCSCLSVSCRMLCFLRSMQWVVLVEGQVSSVAAAGGIEYVSRSGGNNPRMDTSNRTLYDASEIHHLSLICSHSWLLPLWNCIHLSFTAVSSPFGISWLLPRLSCIPPTTSASKVSATR